MRRFITRIYAIFLALLMICFLASGSMAMAEQVTRSHPGCTGGGKEAEELFNLGRDYSKGIHGMPRDREKAIRFYKESFELGNPKAGINLGIFLLMMSVNEPNEQEMTELANSYFQKAIDMGCPDGYYHLAYPFAVFYYKRLRTQIDENNADLTSVIGIYRTSGDWGED